MREKIIRPERRRPIHRQDRLAALGHAVDRDAWSERRVHCWHLESACSEEHRKRCAAHFVQRNCWDLWAAEYFPPGRKPCCHSDLDCVSCPVAQAKFSGPISVYLEVPAIPNASQPGAASRNQPYCPFLHRVSDTLSQREEDSVKTTFRCHHRGGIVLHSSYVTDVCSCEEHRQCTFYESSD